MHILLLGADGFLGRHLKTALRAAGHTVTDGVRHPQHTGQIAVDFTQDHDPAIWLPRLAGIDGVINCVGLFRESAGSSFDAIQVQAPRALYAACRQAGVQRVLLISALGAAMDAPTRYWRSKAAGEQVLMQAGVPWNVLRPSLVYGDDGASSQLFARLATLPVLALPACMGKVQPVHVDDLVAGCVALLADNTSTGQAMDATGPQALPFAVYLRALAGRSALPVLRMPQWLCRATALLAEKLPGGLLTRDSLAMLAAGNTGDGSRFAALVNRPLRDPARFAGATMQLRAQRAVARGWLRTGLAFVWFATAVVSLWVYPVADSHQLLAACHVPPAWFEPMRIGASLLDATFGVLTLLRPGRRLWQLQLVLIAGYSVLVGLFLLEFLAHPFGPLTKNAGLMAALFALLATEEK
ncbi:NAD(P)H-binding protein [Andreprevotia sp. IGB-42]|uniref:NAD(P)H-binding protein n=1 Tax=Andreprevotia sp. IGB-42 TaxID=2497473 RepID=UPI0013578DD2|nr:NAD(P)H-binding protein [Andreprevotia sp. IGB-42]